MYEKLVKFVESMGLWQAGENKGTYAFQLSPEPHVLTAAQGSQLDVLSRSLHEVVTGLSRIFTIATSPFSEALEVGRLMSAEIPASFQGVMDLHPGTAPFLNKIDLVEDDEGKFWIVEMDAGNPRALGYAVFLQAMTERIHGVQNSFPGVLGVTSKVVMDSGLSGELVCMLSGRERWYRPWFEILVRALREKGLKTDLIPEGKFVVREGMLILHMPLVIEKPSVRSALLEAYKQGGVRFLMPPKPFLGSKAMLAIICNVVQDPALEALLFSQISGEHLRVVRAHIPPTVFSKTTWLDGASVLKFLVSSGMKGVIFSSEPDYTDILQRHSKSSTVMAVVQKMVDGRKHSFNHFDPNGQLTQDTRYVRFIAHCGPEGVVDIFVTARASRAVHGSPDSILTGCVFA